MSCGCCGHLKTVYLKRHKRSVKKRERKEANLPTKLKKELQEDVEKGSASQGLNTDIS